MLIHSNISWQTTGYCNIQTMYLTKKKSLCWTRLHLANCRCTTIILRSVIIGNLNWIHGLFAIERNWMQFESGNKRLRLTQESWLQPQISYLGQKKKTTPIGTINGRAVTFFYMQYTYYRQISACDKKKVRPSYWWSKGLDNYFVVVNENKRISLSLAFSTGTISVVLGQ